MIPFELKTSRRCAALVSISCLCLAPTLIAQEVGAFRKSSGQYLDLVTDLPIDDELADFPLVFEKAIPMWCEALGLSKQMVSEQLVNEWHATVFVMLERERFASAGLIPNHLPDFPYGFQYGNEMWVTEQPSPYYRRHLLLHEGTHWFMNRLYGANGPPWLMEGMAELLGTHRWDAAAKTLELAVIPRSKEEVPFWGRVRRIQEQLDNQTAPSLESIMRYSNTAHRNVDAYAWSWAAVLFLSEHPRTKEAFQGMLKQPMSPGPELTRYLFGQLREVWPEVRAEWAAFASDLDYGYVSEPGMLQLSDAGKKNTSAAQLRDVGAVKLRVRSDRSWQASGVIVEAGKSLRVKSDGESQLNANAKPWRSEANGVTLEYYQGEPLGRLMMTIVAPIPREPGQTARAKVIAVGESYDAPAPISGEVFFRINERPDALLDNFGTLSVTLSVGE